uniref:Uncharacterized protein n=1 Tax=Octopus bimaculoides TaxID=37653 RepID=A0A0L8FS09_OCTBM
MILSGVKHLSYLCHIVNLYSTIVFSHCNTLLNSLGTKLGLKTHTPNIFQVFHEKPIIWQKEIVSERRGIV